MTERMTIRDIAGFCPKEAVWKMIADVSQCLQNGAEHGGLSPDAVLVDGNSFLVLDVPNMGNEYLAPEHEMGAKCKEKETVWSLGAIAYFAATGHIVFGGHGGAYQKRNSLVPLPVLPKGLQDLSFVLQRCLCYNPEERVGLKELNSLAQEGLLSCKQQERRGATNGNGKKKTEEVKGADEKWPEEMKEI